MIMTNVSCGTPESWEKFVWNNQPIDWVNIPIYDVKVDNRRKVYIITSQEWCNWLAGRSDKLPDELSQ